MTDEDTRKEDQERFGGKKIFISGPMTGKPNYNFDVFDFWEEKIKRAGGECVNPAHISRKFKAEDVLKHGEVFQQMVTAQLEAMKHKCDTILLLDGWENSSGVRAELATALNLGFTIILETPGEG